MTLYYHPLSSFCWKALIALYENETPFRPHIVDLGDAKAAAAFKAIWPIGKFPVLRDDARGQTVPESSVIIEYLAQHYPGRSRLIPADPDLALRGAPRRSRLSISTCTSRCRGSWPTGCARRARHDPHGVELARAQLRTALDMTEAKMASRTWAVGETFTMADCAAAPALFYADKVMPFGATHPSTAAYLGRLMQRPSFARVLEEAKPYFAMFPG